MSTVKRPDYYEEDAVYYTSRGKHPIIPEKYKSCYFQIGKYSHKLKSFLNEENANIALASACHKNYGLMSGYTIFKCNKCQMYHIILTKNYEKLFN